MLKKPSHNIGLLINNPLNSIKAPPQARVPNNFAASGLSKSDSVHNIQRHQTTENKSSYSMSTSQINSNKFRDMIRQPGAPGLSQNLTNIGIQKSQSLINF